jgi:adenine-specific DNA-methyltransferase
MIIKKGILHGVDVDPIAVRMCKANLRYHLEMDASHEPRVLCGDSLLAPLFSYPEVKNLEGWPVPVDFCKQFADVFLREINGFDVLVMNPPYGKLRAESGKGIRKNTKNNNAEKKRYENLRKYIRESGLYPCSKGVLNWYKLFLERSLNLLNEHGSMGFIVPSTLLCDDSTKAIRKALLDHEIAHLLEIPEKNNYFEDVTQSFSIGILNKDKQNRETDFQFGVKSLKEAETTQERVVLLDIVEVTENSLSIPLTTAHGLSVFLKMHQHPTVSKISNILNKRGEIDLTMFKSALSNSPGDGKKRLLRGADIGFCKLKPIDEEKPSLIDQMKALEMLGNSEKLQHLSMKRIVCQQIANQNNADRLVFAPIDENMFCGNSLNYVCWTGDDAGVWNSVLLGLLNSTLLDWRFKITSTNNHVNNYEIDDLPLPIDWSSQPKLTSELRHVAQIADELKRCNKEDIALLRNKLDKLIFHLYGLSEKDIEFVLQEMKSTEESKQFILER